MSRSVVIEENGTVVAPQNWQCEASVFNRSADASSADEEISTIAEGAGWAA